MSARPTGGGTDDQIETRPVHVVISRGAVEQDKHTEFAANGFVIEHRSLLAVVNGRNKVASGGATGRPESGMYSSTGGATGSNGVSPGSTCILTTAPSFLRYWMTEPTGGREMSV